MPAAPRRCARSFATRSTAGPPCWWFRRTSTSCSSSATGCWCCFAARSLASSARKISGPRQWVRSWSGNGNRPMQRNGTILWRSASAQARAFALIGLVALGVFAILLAVAGKDPLQAYVDTLCYVFGNAYGFSELLVRMIPLLLTALAVALPARIGLINVGGEGQLYMGAWLATAGALTFSEWPAFVLLPTLTLLGFVGGGLWALIPGALRALRLVNETISTLLLNYVAPLIVGYFIFGPWRSPESSAYPQSPAFVEAAQLPTFFHSRVHAGLLYALACLVLYWFVMTRTRFGLEMRAIGARPPAAGRPPGVVFLYIPSRVVVAAGGAGRARESVRSSARGCRVARRLRVFRGRLFLGV